MDYPFIKPTKQPSGVYAPPGQELYYPELDLPEGWHMDDIGNVTTPEGWKLLADGNYISPEGTRINASELYQNKAMLESLGTIFPVKGLMTLAESDPEQFVNTLEEIGDIPETRALLMGMGLEDVDIEMIFNPPSITEIARQQFAEAWGTPDSAKAALGVAGAYLEKYVERPWKWVAMMGSRDLAHAINFFRGEQYTSDLEIELNSITEKYGWGSIFSEETNKLWGEYTEKGKAPHWLEVAYEWTNPAWFLPIGGAAGLVARSLSRIPVMGTLSMGMAKTVQMVERGIAYPLSKPLDLTAKGIAKITGKAPQENLSKWITELPNHESYKAATFKQDWFRKAFARIDKIPGGRKFFTPIVGKSIFVQEEIGKEIIMRLHYLEMGTVDKTTKMAAMRQYGDSLGLLHADEIGMLSTKWVRPKPEFPNASLALRDVAMAPERYIFTNPKGYDFIKSAQQILKDIREMLRKEGIEIHEFPLGDGQEFMGTICTGKRLPDGTIQHFSRGVGKRVGAKVPIEKPRYFEEMMEGINKGYVYSNRLEDYVGTYIEAAWKKVADKRLAEAVELIVGKMEGALPVTAVERLGVLFPREAEAFGRKAIEVSPGVRGWILTGVRKEVADLGYVWAMVKRGARGEALPPATLKAIEARSPEYLAKVQKASRLTGAERVKAFNSLSKQLKTKIDGLRPDWWKAKFGRADAMEKARVPIAGRNEATVNHPAFSNKVYPREIADALNKIIEEDTIKYGMKYPATVSGVLRSFKASLDLSAGRIQGLWTLFYHPLIYAQAEGRSWVAFAKPSTYQKYLNINKEIISQASRYEVYFGGFEYFESVSGLVRFFNKWSFTKPIASLIRETIGRGEAAFGMWGDVARLEMWRAYGTRHIAKGEGFEYARSINRMTGVMSTKAIGLGGTQRALEQAFIFFAPRYKRAGIAFVFDMLRGGCTGAEARKAIGSFLAGGTAAYIGACKALGRPAYIFPYFPESQKDTEWAKQLRDWGFATESAGKKYLSVNIGGRWYGVGGIGYGLLRLLAEITESMVGEGENSPMDLVSLDKWKNPLISYFYKGAAPLAGVAVDVVIPAIEKALGFEAEPQTFLGYPIETPEEYAEYTGELFTPIAFSDVLWDRSGVPISFLGVLGEWMGLRISPQTRWESFTNKAETIINKEEIPDMTDSQRETFDRGELKWEDLDKWQKDKFMEMHTELAPLYEEALIDSMIRQSATEKALERSIGWVFTDEEWERAKLIDPNIKQSCGLRGELRDAEDRIWQQLIDGELDRYTAGQRLREAKSAYRGGWEVLEGEYTEIFDSWDEAKERKIENAELFDICYYEYTELRMDPPEDKYGDIDWDEFTRLENELFAQYPTAYREKVYYCIENNKGQEAPWAVMRWLDVKHLGDAGYWDLPRQQIKNMDEEEIKDLNPDIYGELISKWKVYNEAETDADKARMVELWPDLDKDWRGEFFLSHPELEANAVFWGYRNKFSTREALNVALAKVKELELPEDEFMAGLAMPPENIWDDYFEWIKLGTENGWQSPQVKLFKATHPEFMEFGKEAYSWQDDTTPLEVLEINDKWWKEDAAYEAIQANAKLGVSEEIANARRTSYLTANPEYAKGRRVRDAYNLGIAEWAVNHGVDKGYLVDAYAEFYVAGGKRTGYADERFLMEHMELYEALLDLEIWKTRIYFKDVPTLEVENLYREYLRLEPGVVRLNFRQHHPDLDDWLVRVKGLKPIGDRARGEVAPPPDVPLPPP